MSEDIENLLDELRIEREFATQEHAARERLEAAISTAYCDAFELAWLPVLPVAAPGIMLGEINKLRQLLVDVDKGQDIEGLGRALNAIHQYLIDIERIPR